MNPSDTHIVRMAATFAERTPYLRPSREEAEQVWREALEMGRETGRLERMENHMFRRGTVDQVAQDAWDKAREY